MRQGRTAVVTGGASGIGRAAAGRLLGLGMNVCLADQDEVGLEAAVRELADGEAGETAVLGVPTDVSDLGAVERLRTEALSRFGEVALLMNNAGTGGGGGAWQDLSGWQRVLGVNLWGVIHGVQVFTEGMIDQATPGAIINTASKQGITNPPGDSAYNVSKAGVKSLTESLAHQLRSIEGCRVTAHLLVPGFTYTGMIKRFVKEKPPGAWDPDQVVGRLIEALGRGDFYVICPDNEVTLEVDHRRMEWAVGDMTENRPALSRWHPDYAEAFAAFMDEVES